MLPKVLALDIGGANLKSADNCGAACSRPFALWKDPAGLPDELATLLRAWQNYELLAVTMTGELCDCYSSRREGVTAILAAVEQVTGAVPVQVWRNDGRLVNLSQAREAPLQVASANWLALAEFVGRFLPRGPALLLDVGSTTTDIIPLLDGKPVPRGRTDFERLSSHELVYLGARRTPLCALLGLEGAAEFFATTQDLFLVLGSQDENPLDCDTADGRPATRQAAHARLARMLCTDAESCAAADRQELAQKLLVRLVQRLTSALSTVAHHLPGPPQAVVISGSGEFLARRVLDARKVVPCQCVRSLGDRLGPQVSAAACAHALAVLAAERFCV